MTARHQNVRKLMEAMFTPILLIPVIIVMISPLLAPFLPMFNERIVLIFINSVLLLWLAIAFLALFLGRAHCSHICPITGLFSFISRVKNDRSILSTEYPKIMGKIVLFLWFAAPLYVILRNAGNYAGFLPKEAIYSELSVNLYYILFAVSGVLANTVGKVSVLHYICPFAAFMISASRLGRKLRLPGFRFSYDKDLCRSCGACTKKCLVNRDIPKLIHSDSINFDECVQCRYCAEECRFGAITYGWKKG